MEPGVYQAVDSKSLQKLQEEHKKSIDDSKSRGKVWAKHKEEYKVLHDKLSTIADKTQYNVMVPFGGKKAFFEGQLVHTNEIMVLLGDNWFVERSAKEASEICQRRINRCDEMLEKIDTEINLYQSWQREANQLGTDSERGEGNLEIREPYNEKQEAKWRVEHRERMRVEKLKETKESSEDEDALWRRLDELEIEEELDRHLEEKGSEVESGSEEDWSESPPITDSEDEDGERFPKSRTVKRSVSFGDVSERLFSREQDDGVPTREPMADSETKIIKFEHSEHCGANPGSPSSMPVCPGDLVRMYGQKTKAFIPTPKKSILKAGSKYGPPLPSVETSPVKISSKPKVTAVSDVVIEREAPKSSGQNSPSENPKTPVTQVFSRFRATRVHQ